MKTAIVTSALVANCLLVSALRANFDAEVSLSYENLDANLSGEDLYVGGLTVYTNPLSYAGKTPFDEAAFFNQVGQIDLLYGRATGFSEDFDTFGAAYTYRDANDANSYSASWLHSDIGSDFNQFDIGYDRYLSRGFSVGLRTGLADYGKMEHWTYGLSSKRLFALERNRWVSVEGGVAWAEDGAGGEWTFSGLATYYLSARTGVGLGMATTDRWADYDASLSLTRYLRDNLAVDVTYNRSFLDDSRDSDGIRFGGKYRF